MPLRHGVKGFFKRSKIQIPSRSVSDLPDVDKLAKSISQHVNSPEKLPRVEEQHSTKATPQLLELKGLWKEAYEELYKEDAQLIEAYENAILQQDKNETNRSSAGNDTDAHLQSLVKRRFEEIESSRLKITFAGKEITVREQARRAIDLIISIKPSITAATSLDPHAALAWAGILLLLSPISRTVTQDEIAMEGFEYILKILVQYRVLESTHVKIYLNEPVSKSNKTKPLDELGASIRSQTVKLYAAVLRYQMRWLAGDWKSMLQTIKDIDESIQRELNTFGGNTLREVDRELQRLHAKMLESQCVMTEVRDDARAVKNTQLLGSLPIASGAAFNSYENRDKPQCLEDTQIRALERIQSWCTSLDRDIYWLRGMAGTGKSTISRTFAAACLNRQSLIDRSPLPDNICLGASFFFDQNERERNNPRALFTTICRSLAESLPGLRPEICKSIEKHTNIKNEMLANQWEHLILQPLLELDKQALVPLTSIIVIDALDECESESETDIDTILQLITGAQKLSTIRLKFFITSRPELNIYSSFNAIVGDLYATELPKVLLSNDKSAPKDDITKFLEHELAIITRRHMFKSGWPDEEKIQQLAWKADGLFIYAATACRFLSGRKLSKERLESRLDLLLDGRAVERSPQRSLDAIYSRILQFSVIGDAIEEEKESIHDRFQLIVGAIIMLFEPLSVTALANILSMSESTIKDTLQSLFSVLSVSEEDLPIRLLHLSFRDFLLDQERCINEDFWISQKAKHGELAYACLDVLSKTLKQDICCLGDFASLAADVPRSKVNQYLPAHVGYACRYWVDHLQRADADVEDVGQVHRFLKKQFLYWLEALSLLGKISEGVRAIIVLSDHISSLPHLVPKWIGGLPKVEKMWSPLLQTFESDQGLFDVAFSPDGKLVASSAACLYDSATGTLLKTLDVSSEVKEDGTRGTSVTFSQDGKRVISISRGGLLRVWDVSSGLLITEVKSSVRGKTAHWRLFSHDKTLAVALLDSITVEVIDIANGLLLKTFQPHGGASVSSLALSRDGQTLASASETGVIQLWNAVAITPKHELRRHFGELMLKTRLAFSPDGKILAAWSNRCPISLWDPASGELLGEIPGWFHDACFLPDSKVLVMSCDSEGDDAGFVKLWDVSSGKLVKTIEADCLGLQLSPDGKFFASVSLCYGTRKWERSGREIRVWDITTGNLDKSFSSPFGDLSWLSFSADNTLLVTVSEFGYTIQLWDLVNQSKSLEEFQLESSQIDGFKLSPNQKIAASITSSLTSVSLWDVETGAFLKRLRGGHCSFSPDGKWVLVSNKFTDEVWNLATWELAFSAKKDVETLGIFAFSPDSKLFAHQIDPEYEDRVADIDTENLDDQPLVRIWQTDTWKPLLTFEARYKYQSMVLKFSPNSTLLACGIHDNLDQWRAREPFEATFIIWNVTTGKRQRSCMVTRWKYCDLLNVGPKHTSVGRGDGAIEKDF
ncbi:hypothetical protein N7490_004809 [Penicillium lividum]|nr:hypothetical protein N7490_004809 [Penicillium lividum]